MCRRLLILAGFLALLTAPVRADDAVQADPWELIHIVREFGPAEVGRDAMRDPRIEGEIDGIAYHVDFYGCWLGRECEAILLQMRLAKDDWEPDAEEIADWNAAKLFGRAWIDDETVAVIDHAIAMGGGVPKPVLTASLRAWQEAIEEFIEHIDFK